MGILPEKFNVPVVGVPVNMKMIVEGGSKIGKTTFAASWPDPVLLEFDRGGADHVTCKTLKCYLGQNPLKGLRDAIEALKTDTAFKTVILDPIDEVADLLSKEICADLGIKSITDAPKNARHGAQWERYANQVTGIVGALIALPKNVLVLGHTKPASYDDKGVLKSQESLDIYGKAARILYARVDNIGHMYVINEGGETKTVLSFKAGLDCTRGSRHPALRDKEIILPRDNGYAAFEQLFKEGK